MRVDECFEVPVTLDQNLVVLESRYQLSKQVQTNDAFSEKWEKVEEKNLVKDFINFQKRWYYDLYGFESESDLRIFLKTKSLIFDAGCGLGYKSAWFAELAPHALVLGMDFSESVYLAAKKYARISNLFFIKGDIADTNIKTNTIDYISCDQVLHHTSNPPLTFKHLSSLLSTGGEFACYVYAKKALPRELLDDHFREISKELKNEELWALSQQLTQLGKTLTELNVKFTCPDIPTLGIKGGEYDLQRFIYWNFLKCFWNEEVGWESSVSGNFDWYAPSIAFRYSEKEFKEIIRDNCLDIIYFHSENACNSGRFKRGRN